MKPVTQNLHSFDDGYRTWDFKPDAILLLTESGNPEKQILLQIDLDKFYVLGVRNNAYERSPGERFVYITRDQSRSLEQFQEIENRSDLLLLLDFELGDRFQKLMQKG
jgi:hypothetical protein